MLRFKKFAKKYSIAREMPVIEGTFGVCSADVTSMAEIVKRFNMNEPIPNSQLEQNYQYDNNTITYGTSSDDESVNYESLNLVPMTHNLDDVELPDYEEIGEELATAEDRARSYIRGKKAEMERNKSAKERAEFERLKNTFEPPEPSTVAEVPVNNA